MWGGLIFAAKCGENCLMVRIAFSLKVAAKLPKRATQITTTHEHSKDINIQFLGSSPNKKKN